MEKKVLYIIKNKYIDIVEGQLADDAPSESNWARSGYHLQAVLPLLWCRFDSWV